MRSRNVLPPAWSAIFEDVFVLVGNQSLSSCGELVLALIAFISVLPVIFWATMVFFRKVVLDSTRRIRPAVARINRFSPDT